ncbi:MAG TPA: aromatic ring-hydroxylating dioxygenase subunit alpha [Burkholderiales bacterium]|nr:aromatic ring-hydroxylating dioxygenase subunit alpha [Burkholderiales bacterium]
MALDEGTGYTRAAPSYLAKLAEVGRGTPMGELLRRYWHPVGLGSHATNTPREVRLLGEDLVLFRDGAGRAGLVWARCCHRGTTLYYGKVEERGIRCCYHGWLYDVEGHCLDQPCEPDGGAKYRKRVRQPWYPVEERYGLIFAYMGPPEKKPLLPRYDALEELDEGEFIDVDDTSIGSGGGAVAPCNWLQHFENVVDPFHVPVLHGNFSGTQFVPAMNLMPQVEFSLTPRGVKVTSERKLADGKVMHRTTEVVLPTLRVVPNPYVGKYGRVESIGWTIPIDDTHYRIYTAGRVKEKGVLLPRSPDAAKRRNRNDMTPEERRAEPNDWEAQTGQGPITLHSEEHLATSDSGIVKLRRLLAAQVDAVARGEDPIGVHFDPASAYVRLEAGQHVAAAL